MISGFGFGLLMPNARVWISRTVPEQIRGRSLGGLNTFFFLGEFASPVVVQPLVSAVGIGNGYGVISGFLLVLGAIGFTLGSSYLLANAGSRVKKEILFTQLSLANPFNRSSASGSA